MHLGLLETRGEELAHSKATGTGAMLGRHEITRQGLKLSGNVSSKAPILGRELSARHYAEHVLSTRQHQCQYSQCPHLPFVF